MTLGRFSFSLKGVGEPTAASGGRVGTHAAPLGPGFFSKGLLRPKGANIEAFLIFTGSYTTLAPAEVGSPDLRVEAGRAAGGRYRVQSKPSGPEGAREIRKDEPRGNKKVKKKEGERDQGTGN